MQQNSSPEVASGPIPDAGLSRNRDNRSGRQANEKARQLAKLNQAPVTSIQTCYHISRGISIDECGEHVGGIAHIVYDISANCKPT
jgi:hypothetical protein